MGYNIQQLLQNKKPDTFIHFVNVKFLFYFNMEMWKCCNTLELNVFSSIEAEDLVVATQVNSDCDKSPHVSTYLGAFLHPANRLGFKG